MKIKDFLKKEFGGSIVIYFSIWGGIRYTIIPTIEFDDDALEFKWLKAYLLFGRGSAYFK